MADIRQYVFYLDRAERKQFILGANKTLLYSQVIKSTYIMYYAGNGIIEGSSSVQIGKFDKCLR